MANSKAAPSKSRKKAASKSSNGSAPKARSASTRAKASTRSKPAASTRSRAKSAGGANASKQNGSSSATDRVGQALGTAKQAATKVKGPALAAGAAAVGVAGGLALKGRMRRRTVLGVPMPRSLGKAGLSDLDVKSVAKTVGEASQRFGKTSKAVSRDMERAGEQAERIGKILS